MTSVTGQFSRVRRRAARELGNLSPVAAALLIAAILYAVTPVIRAANGTLDSSWQWGINLAIADGKQFGPDILFTYGPWSELDIVSPISLRLLAPAVICCGIVGIAFVLLAWHLARRWIPSWLAALLVAAIAVPALTVQQGTSDRILVISVMAGMGLATGSIGRRFTLAVLVVLAVFAALALEVKFSNGLLAAATTCLFAVVVPGRVLLIRARDLGIVILVGAFSAVVFWLAAAQHLANLPSWLYGSVQLTTGYAEAMAIEVPNAISQYVVLVLLVVAVFVLVGLSRRGRLNSTWPTYVGAAWTCFMVLRLGFTRHDTTHASEGFLLLLALLVAIGVARLAALSLTAVALAGILTVSAEGVSYGHLIDPGAWATRVGTATSALLSNSYRQSLVDDSRASLVKYYHLPQSVQGALVDKRVAVDPYQSNVAFAYGMTWTPVPVLQTYSAYTPYLDSVNAKALTSPDGPDAVLRNSGPAVDGRNPIWESPKYMLALMCNFTPAVQSGDWMVLTRAGDHCADTTVRLGTRHFSAGSKISVPAAPGPDYLVTASFTPSQSAADSLERLAFKPLHGMYVKAGASNFRLPADNSAGPLLVHVPSGLGWGAAFGGGVDYRTLEASVSGTVQFTATRLG